MNHMQKRTLQRSICLIKSLLKWFLSTVASHMLLQVTVLIEWFVTQDTFLKLLKLGVFASSVGSILFLLLLFLLLLFLQLLT